MDTKIIIYSVLATLVIIPTFLLIRSRKNERDIFHRYLGSFVIVVVPILGMFVFLHNTIQVKGECYDALVVSHSMKMDVNGGREQKATEIILFKTSDGPKKVAESRAKYIQSLQYSSTFTVQRIYHPTSGEEEYVIVADYHSNSFKSKSLAKL